MRAGYDYLEHFYLIDLSIYDTVIGYRAYDSYFSFARAFLSNTISLSQLSFAMHLGKLGEQVVLKSENSYQNIRFIGYEPVNASMWYPARMKRDKLARQSYFRQDREGWQKGELYMPQILDEEIGPDDIRIRRIIY